MHVTTGDLWAPAPGRVLSWEVSAGGTGRRIPLSFNQKNHLAAAAGGEPAVWLATAFEVDGPLDEAAAQEAFAALVARHGVLQTVPTSPTHGVRLDRAAMQWSAGIERVTSDVEETRSLLTGLFHEGCRSAGFPGYVTAGVSRPDRSHLIIAMGHFYTDAFSLSVIVDDLAHLYDAARGRPVGELPPAACFVAAVRTDAEEPVRLRPDDERLLHWQGFLRRRGNVLPSFPLPLGLPPGERVAQETYVGPLADTETTEGLGGAGHTTSAVVLAELPGAVGDLGGPAELDLLMPLHTRSGPQELRAVGWYTTTVPLTLRCDVQATGVALRGARRLRDVPLEQLLVSLPEPPAQARRDVFMASYLDYRRLPGHERARERHPEHISSSTLADDLQLWVSRTDAGLGLRVRHPATAEGREVVQALAEAWSARLRAAARREAAGCGAGRLRPGVRSPS